MLQRDLLVPTSPSGERDDQEDQDHYLTQSGGNAGCALYALANALVSMGDHPPQPGTPEWDSLVELGSGLNGYIATEKLGLVAENLGLKLTPIEVDDAINYLPVMLSVWNPRQTGGAIHWVLITAVSRDHRTQKLEAHVVNFHEGGSAVEMMSWEDIHVPPADLPIRRCYAVQHL